MCFRQWPSVMDDPENAQPLRMIVSGEGGTMLERHLKQANVDALLKKSQLKLSICTGSE